MINIQSISFIVYKYRRHINHEKGKVIILNATNGLLYPQKLDIISVNRRINTIDKGKKYGIFM